MDKHRSIHCESLSQPPSAVSMCRGSAVEVAVSLEVSLEAATVEAAETATGPLGSGSSSWALPAGSASNLVDEDGSWNPSCFLYRDTLILFHCYVCSPECPPKICAKGNRVECLEIKTREKKKHCIQMKQSMINSEMLLGFGCWVASRVQKKT